MGRIIHLSAEEWTRAIHEGLDIPFTTLLDGSSMQPLIRRNRDEVQIVPLRRKPQKGDIVLFYDGRWCVHRVLSTGERIITLGDNCMAPDRPHRPDEIYGLVVSMTRNGRRVSLDTPLSRAWGRFWMFLLPVRRIYKKARSLAGRVKRHVLNRS